MKKMTLKPSCGILSLYAAFYERMNGMQETTQTIYGKSIRLKSDLTTDRVDAVVKRLNTEMESVGQDRRSAYEEVLLLAALNMTEDLLALEAEYRQLADILDDDAFSDKDTETET